MAAFVGKYLRGRCVVGNAWTVRGEWHVDVACCVPRGSCRIDVASYLPRGRCVVGTAWTVRGEWHVDVACCVPRGSCRIDVASYLPRGRCALRAVGVRRAERRRHPRADAADVDHAAAARAEERQQRLAQADGAEEVDLRPVSTPRVPLQYPCKYPLSTR
jgi:hypothetical protein